MTCIVGIAANGKVYIGGDSAGVGGLDLTVRADEKVFVNDEMLFGFTSSFRMGQLLRYKLSLPQRPEKVSDFEYLATTFIDAVRSTLKAGGFCKTDCGVESGGTFLLGYRGGLYAVQNDFQIALTVDGYDACGCGEQIANGSLYSTGSLTPAIETETRIRLALGAAEHHSAGVRGPFLIREI